MWLATRSLHSLLVGLPAGVLLCGVLLFAALGPVTATPQSLDHYEQLAHDAYAGDDFDAAELWSRKVVSAQPENDAARFLLALSLAGQGDVRRAHTHMRRLAPQGETGYGPAHVWQAEMLLDAEGRSAEQLRAAVEHLSAARRAAQHPRPGAAPARVSQMLSETRIALARLLAESPLSSPELLNEAKSCLEIVLEEHRDHAEANLVMARVLGRLGADRRAIDHLRRIAEDHPDARSRLAAMYLKLGEADRARKELEAARDEWRARLDQLPHDVNARLRLADAHTQLGEFPAAIRVLHEALPDVNAQGDPRRRKAWASVCIAAIAIELKRPHTDWERLLRVIDVGLSVADDDPRLYEAIAVVLGRHQPADSARLRSILEEALAAGRAPATCHFLLGSVLGATGEIEQGIQHLRTALKEYPEHPIIANNLAMLLLRARTPQPEEALHLATRAVSAAPALAAVRDTRGQALFALGRYEEALPELEKAISVEQDRALRHQMLAEVYQHRGDTRMAEKHRQSAASFSSE
jgi:tetratricopeptide (TPR) repeat protein